MVQEFLGSGPLRLVSISRATSNCTEYHMLSFISWHKSSSSLQASLRLDITFRNATYHRISNTHHHKQRLW